MCEIEELKKTETRRDVELAKEGRGPAVAAALEDTIPYPLDGGSLPLISVIGI